MRRLNIVKVLVLPKLIYRFIRIKIYKYIFNKSISRLFCGYQQTDSKVYVERKKNQNSKHSSEREKQSGKTDTT